MASNKKDKKQGDLYRRLMERVGEKEMLSES